MKVFRIVKRRYAEEPLSGKGAQVHGGRWNSAGTALVYAAATLELAALEILVHWSRISLLPEMVRIGYELPDGQYRTLRPEVLPEGWNDPLHYPETTTRIGDEFIREGSMLCMWVPSVIIPTSHNVLINPEHTLAQDIRVDIQPFEFDPRLSKIDS